MHKDVEVIPMKKITQVLGECRARNGLQLPSTVEEVGGPVVKTMTTTMQ